MAFDDVASHNEQRPSTKPLLYVENPLAVGYTFLES